MTTPSFCQTAISDTTIELVCIPRNIMDSVIADLQKGDIAKEEVEALNEQMQLRTTYEANLEQVASEQKAKIILLSTSLQETSDLSDNYKLQLDKVARQSEKRKRWLNYLSFALTTSLLINFAK